MRNNVMYNNEGYYVGRVPNIPQAKFKQCDVNVTYDTVSPKYPMRNTIYGPTSLKQLYWKREIGVSPDGNTVYRGNYIPQYMQVPENTLYLDRRIKTEVGDKLLDETFRRYGGKHSFLVTDSSVDDAFKRDIPFNERVPEPLADQVFPFHQYSPKEIREYTETIPYPALQNWTNYSTKRTGQFNR